MNRNALVAVALLAVAAGAAAYALRPPEVPTSLADCRFALGETQRTNCLTRLAIQLFRTDPDEAITFTDTHLPTQLDRDFVYLQVTMTIDAKTAKYCLKIQDKSFQKACMERVKRPHLDGDRRDGGAAEPRKGPNMPAPGGVPPN